MPTEVDVAVVGGGPSGGAVAHFLAARGHFTMPAWLVSRVARQLIAAAAMGAVLFFLQRMLGDVFTGGFLERVIGLGIIVGTGAVLYFGIAWLIGGIDRDDFRTLLRRSPAITEEEA